MSQPYGTGELLTSVIDDARRYAVDAERKQVAQEIRDLVSRSGLIKKAVRLVGGGFVGG